MRVVQGASWAVLLMVALVWCGGSTVPAARAQMSPSQCKQEKNLLVAACRPVIFGASPSPACCQRIRVTHVECVCPYVTPKMAALIEVGRVAKQIKGCGRTFPHNFKCGSITFP